MTFEDKLRKMNLPADTQVVLKHSSGTDVVHVHDDYVDMALQETGIAEHIATLVTDPTFKNEVIDELRESDYLEEYPRDYSGFDTFVADVLTENFYDMEFIEHHTEMYDYKRGYLTLEANVPTTVGDILSACSGIFYGWSVTVETDIGTVTVE